MQYTKAFWVWLWIAITMLVVWRDFERSASRAENSWPVPIETIPRPEYLIPPPAPLPGMVGYWIYGSSISGQTTFSCTYVAPETGLTTERQFSVDEFLELATPCTVVQTAQLR